MNKPPIGIIPRHFWLKERIHDCVKSLQKLHDSQDWDLYREKSKTLAEEILYCTTEWEKYYK